MMSRVRDADASPPSAVSNPGRTGPRSFLPLVGTAAHSFDWDRVCSFCTGIHGHSSY